MLFGKTTLMMTTTQLLGIAILTPLSGIGGAFLFPRLQASVMRWSNLAILTLLVCLAAAVPVYGLFFLRAQWEMFVLATVFGAIYGSFQSFARSCFAELVPASQSARWFGECMQLRPSSGRGADLTTLIGFTCRTLLVSVHSNHSRVIHFGAD